MAMWSLLGPRAVDVLVWESFGAGWEADVTSQLKLNVRTLAAPYGKLPDLAKVDFAHDVVFAWNGTTSGVRVPDAEWIPSDRQGLTLVDATSAVFAQAIDWAKTDAVTFSWQKVLGGEAAHGMLILSPRAVERLESHSPSWPLPKLFRMVKSGRLDGALFEGETINTPSMLCVEDYLDALSWAEEIGGLDGLFARADRNARVLFDWIERTTWISNLAEDPATRSNTSVCLSLADAAIAALSPEAQARFVKAVVVLLDREDVAKDIGSYRDAPPGLRIWTGATVEAADLEALTPWLDWAFAETKRSFST
jgi:phosphoserine aminotransferase